ncbi:hypothetical protein [Salipiger sp. PrR003]|uniref:hypothetical protein n=1 Tax=Salipiger sp. PrR003 TaxID=2706776 RepID=UPI0019445A39
MLCWSTFPLAQRRPIIDAHILAALILTPFVLAFVYAGVHEYLRYKSEGRATYGLVFDEETGTSYVTGIGEEDEAFDPEEFNPDDYNESSDNEVLDRDQPGLDDGASTEGAERTTSKPT